MDLGDTLLLAHMLWNDDTSIQVVKDSETAKVMQRVMMDFRKRLEKA